MAFCLGGRRRRAYLSFSDSFVQNFLEVLVDATPHLHHVLPVGQLNHIRAHQPLQFRTHARQHESTTAKLSQIKFSLAIHWKASRKKGIRWIRSQTENRVNVSKVSEATECILRIMKKNILLNQKAKAQRERKRRQRALIQRNTKRRSRGNEEIEYK